jgi:dynein heavy chain
VREFDYAGEEAEAAAAASRTGNEADAQAVGILVQTASRYYVAPLADGSAEPRAVILAFPEEDTVYDWVFSPAAGGKGGVWKGWLVGVPKYEVPSEATYTSLIIPSVDTVRSGALLDLLCYRGKHVMCVGETGTGKSVTLRQKLMGDFPQQGYNPIFLNFSAQTSANQTQEIIDGKMARRRKGVFGPPMGTKFVVFVDDLNMPSKEKYGAQPPIEILRQWMDHGGWYDRKDKDQAFMELVDVQFVVAMGPPGGGRTAITNRYQRHFNVLSFVPFDDSSLTRVFTTIVNWCTREFSSSVKACVGAVVAATIDIYTNITKQMLPTPAKSHYTFNLRDLSKVFQGCLMGEAKKVP